MENIKTTPVQKSSKATASLVLSIASVVTCWTGIVGLGCAIAALCLKLSARKEIDSYVALWDWIVSRLKKREEMPPMSTGTKLCWAAQIVGVVGVIFSAAYTGSFLMLLTIYLAA